jgi:hypothetical protein
MINFFLEQLRQLRDQMLISTQAAPVAAATAPADAAVSIHHRIVPHLGADFQTGCSSCSGRNKGGEEGKGIQSSEGMQSFPSFQTSQVIVPLVLTGLQFDNPC